MSALKRLVEAPLDASKPVAADLRPEGIFEDFAPFTARIVRHPHFFLRIGGEACEQLQEFGSTSAVRCHDLLRSQRRKLASEVDAACRRLERLIPETDDKNRRRNLIQVRRDLFNGRIPKQAVLESVLSQSDVNTAEQLNDVVTGTEYLGKLEESGLQAHAADLKADAAVLRRAAMLPNLRAALLASSPSLFQALRKLEAGAQLRNKDWANLHLAISSFLTRSTLKTSPKSSLTLVALGSWGGRGAHEIEFALNDVVIRRDVRLRHSIIERIFRPLAANAAMLSPDAMVFANPTIDVKDGQVAWQRIAFSEGSAMETYGIAATTNLLRPKPDLHAILDDLASMDGSWSLGAYSDHIRSRFRLSSILEAEALVARLMVLDLLVLKNDVPAQSDRLLWARSIVNSLKTSISNEMAERLDRLEVARMAVCKREAPMEAGRAVERALDELAIATTAPLRSERFRPVFYEDCMISSPSIVLSTRAIESLESDLLDLMRLLPLLRGYGWASAWLTRRFVTTFGVGGRCEDAVSFLSGAAELLAAAGDGVSAGGDEAKLPPWQTGSVPDDTDALALDAVSRAFGDSLAAHVATSGSWTIPKSLVDRFYREIPATYRNRARSHCINGQFATFAGTRKFVVNSVYPGNARMTSRFLETGGRVADYIEALAPGVPVAISGMFGFNANRHPKLCDRELAIPPYESDYADTQKISLDRCTLRHDTAHNQIILEDADGVRLSPYYFGILNSWTLPPIHRVLDWMNGASDLPFSIADAVFSRDRPEVPPEIFVRPRLTMGDMVLARKSFSIAKSALPDPALSDAAFYFALRDAWERHDLPAVSFFQASNFWQSHADGSARPHKTRKPMYLDIENVWFVKSFQRSLRKITGHVGITEALPVPGDTPVTITGRRHASEITIELGMKEVDV